METILAPTLRAPLPARGKQRQFLRRGENCCHGERLGTQGSVQLAITTIGEPLEPMRVLRVGEKTNAGRLAGAVAKQVKQHGQALQRCIT